MRQLAAVCLLFLTTNLFAYRGRPVADLRFDGREWDAGANAVATDGEDFLALIGFRVPFSTASQHHLFTQKIVDGRPVGPQHRIASGQGTSLIWTGSKYLASWTDGDLTQVGRLSQEGSLFGMAPPLSLPNARLLQNGDHVLAVSQSSVQALNANGNPTGPVITHSVPGFPYGAGPAGDGFALLFQSGTDSSGNDMFLLLLRADGTAVLPAPVVIATVDYGVITRVATDGTDTLIVLEESHVDTAETLRTIVIGANGAKKSDRVIFSHQAVSVGAMDPRALLWDGTRYILALGLQRMDGLMDPATMSIARNGERIGDVAWTVQMPHSQTPTSLAWNGSELLMAYRFNVHSASGPSGSYCVSVNPATMQGSTPVPFARTLGAHDRLAIAAGSNGYYAAWFDRGDGTTSIVRGSRIDRQGNYLDGDGIVLGTLPSPNPLVLPTIEIDGNGPQWLVVWSSLNYSIGVNRIRARRVSHAGVPSPETIDLGPGYQADVIWNGAQYVVLRSDNSLHRDTVSADGTITSTVVLAQTEEQDDDGINYVDPVLTRLGNETIGVYVKEVWTCPTDVVMPAPCSADQTVTGLRLEADASPFVIATITHGRPAVASNGSQALVAWAQYPEPRAAILTAAQPEQPGSSFVINGAQSIAVDGSDFLAVAGRVSMQRISNSGMVAAPVSLPLEELEISLNPVIASSATLPPLAGFVQRVNGSANVPRAALLFASELDDEAGSPPPPPTMVCATKNNDGTITVRWQPMPNILGMSIELQLPDGMFRQIANAAAGANSARVAIPELEGDVVRVRAWNAGGLSAPSVTATSTVAPTAQMRWSATACASVPTTIEIELSGTPPFTIHWRDGLVQQNIMTNTATRIVTLSQDTTFTIASLSDASCAINETPESVRISVTPQPKISDQTRNVQIQRNETATLTVTATDATSYAWFEGARGDTTRPIGGTTASVTTPPLTASTRYWVRVSNRCGSVDSFAMNVAVSGKRRVSRR